MKPSESPDSKDAPTTSLDAGASEIVKHVESSPPISSHGQTSSTGNDQVMAVQPQQANVEMQPARPDNVNEQQPGSDEAMNMVSQQVPPNQIVNVPNQHIDQQHQQLLNNNLSPRLPMNARPRNGPYDQPPQVRPIYPPFNPRIPMNPGIRRLSRYQHFHFIFGRQDWTFNDFSKLIPVRIRQQGPWPPRPPQEIHGRRVNECYRLPMHRCQLPPTSGNQQNGRHNGSPHLLPSLPPLISRREIEPGILLETYSHRKQPTNIIDTFYGVPRCLCRNLNYENIVPNHEMITVVVNTPNLTRRLCMNLYREGMLRNMFKAYFGMTYESAKTVFVACGKRLKGGDTPNSIGMRNKETIYTFINPRTYHRVKKRRVRSS